MLTALSDRLPVLCDLLLLVNEVFKILVKAFEFFLSIGDVGIRFEGCIFQQPCIFLNGPVLVLEQRALSVDIVKKES